MNDKKTWLAIGLSAAAVLVGYIAYQQVNASDDDDGEGIGSDDNI